MKIEIDQLKSCLTEEERREATFGVEREGLRVTPKGRLAMTPHPAVFGNKLVNPYITTDFSESQVEVVTPTLDSVAATYDFLAGLCDIVQDELSEDEYFWPQSMPCDIPEDDRIPIAVYEGEANAEAAMAYRRGLMHKYGAKKQLISGIHFNFSFTETFFDKLRQGVAPEMAPQAFKDAVYLKIARNYLRTRWLLIYLTGCSVGLHKSYIPSCVAQMDASDDAGSYLETTGPSFRNSSCGYKNLKPVFPDYSTVAGFARDVEANVAAGFISAPKELYTQVRLKPRDVGNLLESLTIDGIKYLEIRTVDLNVFDPCGIARIDMDFIHWLMLYLVVLPESDHAQWQQEGLYNEELVATQGLDTGICLRRDGSKVIMADWDMEILEGMQAMDQALGLGAAKTLDEMIRRLQHPEKTYASRLAAEIAQKGYIAAHLEKAVAYKKQSRQREVIFRPFAGRDAAAQRDLKDKVTRGIKIE